ncbi:MAG: CBS domain-containing protein [Alphaproteobacteria bacterium]|nr:CBS domain-containing protein [Alphaproteobacteria bacterium]
MNVGDVLTKAVIFMSPNADLLEAMKAMNDHGFRHLPILNDGKLLGVISIRDMLALAIPFEGEISKHPVFTKAAG